MAQFRIRLAIKRGERGVSLATLSEIAKETQKFLRMMGEDVAIEALQAGWIATEFENGSVSFTIESTGEADEDQVRKYRRAVAHVISYEPKSGKVPPGIRNETIVQYAKITGTVSQDESLQVGLFTNGPESPADWRDLTKQQATGILEYFEDWVESSGTIQGIIHSLYKEAQPPHFDIRELSSGALVKCVYAPRLYNQVVSLLKKKDAVILVQGHIKARRMDRKIDHIVVKLLEEAPELSDEVFEGFFGCAPDFTGGLSTEEYLRKIRGTAD